MASFPATASFSGHETFPFRYAWLKKGVDAARNDPEVFSKEEEAMTILGVGKNMVRSIRHWCLTATVLQEMPNKRSARRGGFQPSEIGEWLFSDDGADPYLEDPMTLWLLHWAIASNPLRATTWFWAFSYVHDSEFTKDTLLEGLQNWVNTAGWKRVSPSSLRRDLDCLIRTYLPARQTATVPEDTLDCPLVELNLICDAGARHTYRFNRGPQALLPDGILFYATLDYWDRVRPDRDTMSLHDLAHQPGSPGRLFKIDEDSLAMRYEQVEQWTKGSMNYDETAGMKQLYRREKVSPIAILKQTYRTRTRENRATAHAK